MKDIDFAAVVAIMVTTLAAGLVAKAQRGGPGDPVGRTFPGRVHLGRAGFRGESRRSDFESTSPSFRACLGKSKL